MTRSVRTRMGVPVFFLMVSGLSACMAGMRMGVDEPVAPVMPLAMARLAIMPVTAEAGSEGLRSELAGTLHEVLGERFPWVAILGPEEAGARLAQSSAAARGYADLLADYERTGVVDSERLALVTQTLDVDHFLQVRVAYEREDFLDPLLFSFDEFAKENRQIVVVVTRVWTDKGPGPAWEAVVRTTSETDDFQSEVRGVDELIRVVVEGLADRIPVQGPEGT